MNYKTIKGYLGGGYVDQMNYQTGGYIPGLSEAKYGIGLQRDLTQTNEELMEEAKKLEKKQKFKKYITTGVDTLLRGMGAPKSISAGISEVSGGAFAGLLSGVKDIKSSSSTGLLGDDFKYLSDTEDKMTNPFEIIKGGIGSAAGVAASDYLKGLSQDVYKPNVFDEDLSESTFAKRTPLTSQDTPKFGEGYKGFSFNMPNKIEIPRQGESFNFSGISEDVLNKYKNEFTESGGINWKRNLQEAIDSGVVQRNAQQGGRIGYMSGGKIGAYSGGKGLLSIMPFSRRIV